MNANYGTIDGVDVSLDIESKIEYVELGNSSVDIRPESSTKKLIHNCTNKNGCDYFCNDIIQCFRSEIDCDNPTGCNIHCNGVYSCLDTKIVADSSNATELVIICNGENSCQDMHIDIYGVERVNIHCIGEKSCVDVQASFDGISSENNTNTFISCYTENACIDLHILADGPYTQLNMYAYSSGIILDNGWGYISDLDTITCGLDQKFIKYEFDDTVQELVQSEYDQPYTMPCSDITVICDLNQTIISDDEYCNMVYKYEKIVHQQDLSCIYAALYDVVKMVCEGNCISSPTSAPTIAPSSSPSEVPSSSPSQSPTAGPTAAPTVQPTDTPTNGPTNTPTSAPTTKPTENPSLAPTIVPSLVPSFSPSYPPSTSPSLVPTAVPSTSPSLAPSISPSVAPSNVPSNNPTDAPSFAPSFSPSTAPSNAPSESPTHNPISSKDFDSFMLVQFTLSKLDPDDIIKIMIHTANVTNHFEITLKHAYFEQDFTEYQEYLLNIEKIDDTNTDKVDRGMAVKWNNYDSLIFETRIECDEYICPLLIRRSENDGFITSTQENLRTYFQNSNLEFHAEDSSSLTIQCKDCEKHEQFNYVLVIIASIIGLFIIAAILAFLFNKGKFPKLPGFNIVDNARWTALISFGLQIGDFFSDLNLTIELWTREDTFNDYMILGLAAGTSFFLLLPYVTNIIIASKIKNIIRNNQAAKGWFQYHTPIFTTLVVFTGGAHAALSLVSSGIFGLKIMTSGLTEYEVKKLNKIKVIGTVILENVPQLILGALYAYHLTQLTPNTALALSASILSITAAVLSYWIERDAADTKVVEYYLVTECSSRTNTIKSTITNIGGIEEEKSAKIISNLGDTENKANAAFLAAKTITEEEKENLLNNRGRTEGLGFEICEVFGIAPKNLEVGYSMLTKYGIITHIVHFVYEDDLEIMEEELVDEIDNHAQINVTSKFYVSQLYASMQININKVFRSHFDINDDFEVTLQHRLSSRKRTMTEEDNNRCIKNTPNLDESHLDESQMKNVLEKYFNQKRVTSEMDRMNVLSQLIFTQDNDELDIECTEVMDGSDNIPKLDTVFSGETNIDERNTMEIEMEALSEQVLHRL